MVKPKSTPSIRTYQRKGKEYTSTDLAVSWVIARVEMRERYPNRKRDDEENLVDDDLSVDKDEGMN